MGAAGSDGSILETPRPFDRWSTNGAECCDALSTLTGMGSSWGLYRLRLRRRFMPPCAGARSAMFLSVADARLLCEPSTWHSTAGPTSMRSEEHTSELQSH